MFDFFTGWKVSVESADDEGPYVIVSEFQVDSLCRVLAAHRIPHAVEAKVPSRHHAESPTAVVVRVGITVEAAHVQNVIDLAP